MAKAGQIVLFRFPNTNLTQGKLRPALVIGKIPGPFNDWLVCMISTQTQNQVKGFDDLIVQSDGDFTSSGLKVVSVIRTGRLAVVNESMLFGSIGEVDSVRLNRVRQNLANWLAGQAGLR